MTTWVRFILVAILATMTTACASSEIVQRRAFRTDKPVQMNGGETIEQSIARLEVEPQNESPEEYIIRMRALDMLKKQIEVRARADSPKPTPAEIEARRQVEKEAKERAEKAEARLKAKIDTGLRCQTPEEEDAVWISGSVSERWSTVVHTTMTIINMTDTVWQISRVSGRGGSSVVVENLCPRGRITLQERMLGHGQTTVAYSAINTTDDATVATSFSPQLTMQWCSSIGCTAEFPGVWIIRPQ